jgi:hypothetical protein
MESNQIQILLVKYFEGNSTLEEERQLQEFFTDNAIDEEFLPLKKQFDMFRYGSNYPLVSSELESLILENIDKYEAQAHPPKRTLFVSRLLIAASIALVIAFSGILFIKNQNRTLKDTYSDPQLAYLETQKALLFVSQKMNKGIEPLSNISKINRGTEQLKNIEKMDKSLEMLNFVSFINQSSNLKK